MRSISLRASAKINLALDVVGVRADGYHLLNMVMQTIDLYDIITLTKTNAKQITLCCNLPDVPADRTNTVIMAATCFFATIGQPNQGLAIGIKKSIPMQAGLAGGSADAAAVLFGLNLLFEAHCLPQQLCDIGKQVGADVPFCLIGGTAQVTGIGEIIMPLSPLPPLDIVVVKPTAGMDTKQAFARYDQQFTEQTASPHPGMGQLIAGLQAGELSAIMHHLYNKLEQVCPLQDVPIIKKKLLDYGARGTLMSGSGSAVFGLFPLGSATACVDHLKKIYPQTFLCHPTTQGITVLEIL